MPESYQMLEQSRNKHRATAREALGLLHELYLWATEDVEDLCVCAEDVPEGVGNEPPCAFCRARALFTDEED